MKKSAGIHLRIEPDFRQNIINGAHGMGKSMAELMLWATCSYMIKHNLALYEEFEKLEQEMSPGAKRDKVARLRHEAALKIEYWGKQAMAVEKNGRAYEVRGAAESFMEKVKTEA